MCQLMCVCAAVIVCVFSVLPGPTSREENTVCASLVSLLWVCIIVCEL